MNNKIFASEYDTWYEKILQNIFSANLTTKTWPEKVVFCCFYHYSVTVSHSKFLQKLLLKSVKPEYGYIPIMSHVILPGESFNMNIIFH